MAEKKLTDLSDLAIIPDDAIVYLVYGGVSYSGTKGNLLAGVVVQVANYAALPAIGSENKIYITIDDNKQYRWSGAAYVLISSGVPTLAQVLTSGNSTNGTEIYTDGYGQRVSMGTDGFIIHQDDYSGNVVLDNLGYSATKAGKYVFLKPEYGLLVQTNATGSSATLKSDNLTGATSPVFQFPNKGNGTQTLAMVSDIDALKDGVSGSGDTLQKLYNLIISGNAEVVVANTAARNAYNVPHIPFSIFVTDDGDGDWAKYQATTTGVGATFVKLSDPQLLNAVMSNAAIKTAYESNSDTNAFTNTLLAKLNGIASSATANSSDAYLLSRTNHSGTQLAATISDFDAAAVLALASALLLKVDVATLASTLNDRYRNNGVFYFNDFCAVSVDASIGTVLINGGNLTAVSYASVPVKNANSVGFAKIFTGASASGGSRLHFASGATAGYAGLLGNGAAMFETMLEVDVLSTSSERYATVFGFASYGGNIGKVDGIFFTYDEGGVANGTTASANWQCVTVKANVRTVTNTGVAVDLALNKFRIEVNAAATSVGFYINGTLVATHTNNIGLYFGGTIEIIKSIGTTGRNIYADYLAYKYEFTTPR